MPARSMDDHAQSLANALAGERAPPAAAQLSADELAYWGVVMRARARDEWAESDLYIAAELARTLADQERIRVALKLEGDVLCNARGTVVANPKHGLLEIISRRILALRKDLRINSAALAPLHDASETLLTKRGEEATARAALAESKHDGLDDDELLAAPLRH